MKFFAIINSIIEGQILEEIKQSNGYALIIDESTDITQEIHIVLTIQYWQKNSLRNRFFKLLKLTDKKAETIYQEIKKFLVTKGLELLHLIAICTDGTNSMSSLKSGLLFISI